MPISIKKRTLGAKVESTPGTAATLAAADYNFKPFNIGFNLDIEIIDRPYSVGDFQKFSALRGKKMGSVSFSVHLAEASTSGNVPNFGKLLKACSLLETDAGATITYELSDLHTFAPLTIEVVDWEEGSNNPQKVYRFKGCSGKVKFVCDGVGRPVEMQFEFMGAYLGCTDRAYADRLVPTAYETSLAPSFLNGTATYSGTALKTDKWTLDLGIELSPEVDPADDSGILGYHVVDHNPTYQGDPLSKLESVDGLEAAYENGTMAALSMTLGSTITLAAPKMEITKVGVADRGQMVVKNIEGALRRNASDDATAVSGPAFTLTIG